MKKIISLFVLLLIVGLSNIYATDVSGSITANTTWTAANSPYVITGNVSVNSGITLTVESGVSVRFNSNMGIYVYGTMNATGAEFTSNLTTKSKGDWDRIQVGDGSNVGNVTMNNCNIQYGGKNGYGAFYAYKGNLTLNNSTSVSNSSSSGVLLDALITVSISNSSISGCDWPILFNNSGVLHNVGGNNFTGNKHDAAYINFYSINSTWKLEYLPIPYVFISSFTIQNSGVLNIVSGNALKCNNWIYVDGVLNAVADKSQKIIFTTDRDDNVGGDTNADGVATVPTRSSWGGIYFRNGSNDSQCVLRRCDVNFGGTGNRGGIVIENASPTIDSCSLSNNYYGAEITGVSKPNFTNNTMASSQVVPIAMSFDSDPVFSNNTFSFSDNQYDAIGLLGGTLAANSHLIKRDVTGIPNVTYLMLGEVNIPQAYSLTIDPGIVIKCPNYYSAITVAGTLIANGGSGNDQIIFTSSKDDNHGNPKDTNKDGTQTNPVRGDWSGIIFEGTSDNTKCLLNNCQEIGRAHV